MAFSIAYHHSLFFLLAITSPFVLRCASSSRPTRDEGFSIELIHRDSPRSPYFNKSETQYDRISNAIARSVLRVKHIAGADDDRGEEPVARVRLYSAEYLVTISIGTPPIQITGVLDTGSDLIWTQCQPCDHCSPTHDPLFDPSKSSSYQDVTCFSKECSWLGDAHCDPVQGRICQYRFEYMDGTSSSGSLARETITLNSASGQVLSFNSMLLGCGHKNKLVPPDGAYSGIVGLAGGQMSLVSQLGQVADGKFSHCLLPIGTALDKSSKLNFGRRASVSGAGTVCIPYELDRTQYSVTLKSVTVHGDKFDFEDRLNLPYNDGSLIVDSGTAVSHLGSDLYDWLESTVAQRIKAAPVPSPSFLRLCYNSSTKIHVPAITFHFVDSDLELGPTNILVPVSESVSCLAFLPAKGGDTRFYGAMQQTNFWVGYDLQQRVICFKPADCTNIDM